MYVSLYEISRMSLYSQNEDRPPPSSLPSFSACTPDGPVHHLNVQQAGVTTLWRYSPSLVFPRKAMILETIVAGKYSVLSRNSIKVGL